MFKIRTGYYLELLTHERLSARFKHPIVPNKSFGQLSDISPKNLIKTFNLEF